MGLLFDVSENRLDEVNIRLEKGEDVNQADKSGNTALHLAAEKGLAEMTTLLIRHGADLNAANACPGWSPLHYAAYEGHALVVQILLDGGASPDPKDKQGDTPETWALEWENYKCAMILADAIRKKAHSTIESRAQPEPKVQPKSKSDDSEDDDDEECTHWVLPQTNPNIPSLKTVPDKALLPQNEEKPKEQLSEANELLEEGSPDQNKLSDQITKKTREVPVSPTSASPLSDHSSGYIQQDTIKSQEEPNPTPPNRPSPSPSIPTPPPPPPPPPPPSSLVPLSSKTNSQPDHGASFSTKTGRSGRLSRQNSSKSVNKDVKNDMTQTLLEELKIFTGARKKVLVKEEKKTAKERRRSRSRDPRRQSMIQKEDVPFFQLPRSQTKSDTDVRLDLKDELEMRMYGPRSASIVDKIKDSLSSSPNPEQGQDPRYNPLPPLPSTRLPEKPPGQEFEQLFQLTTDQAFSLDLRKSAADLASLSRFGDLARISKAKEDLVSRLTCLIDEEKRQLETDLARKIEEFENMKKRHREEEDRVQNEISLLSEKLENLAVPPILDKAKQRFSPELEKELTCVSCSYICIPPTQIFQCDDGDLLCETCKSNPELNTCPECNKPIDRPLARNRALEKLAKKHYQN